MSVQPITVTEFRANMKELLDQTKDGPIYISRGWEIWKVERLGKAVILHPPVKEKLDTMPNKNKPVATPLNKESKDYSTCKHGSVKGFCKKGCK